MVLEFLGQKADWVSTGLCSYLEARRENLFSYILQLLRATNVPRPTGACQVFLTWHQSALLF